jgi:Fur family transcriptional regulator, zinc uptake regulator
MSHDCAHDHEDGPGLTGDRLAIELAGAERRCAVQGQRLTHPRRRALELLLIKGQPMKAYDLIDKFGTDGQSAKPPTVYRALDFLEKQGFIHRIESLNAFVICHHGERAHAAAFLICDCCGASAEIEPIAGQEIVAIGERTGFFVQALTIEAHGLCKACRP